VFARAAVLGDLGWLLFCFKVTNASRFAEHIRTALADMKECFTDLK
jgi:hypothetical protein